MILRCLSVSLGQAVTTEEQENIINLQLVKHSVGTDGAIYEDCSITLNLTEGQWCDLAKTNILPQVGQDYELTLSLHAKVEENGSK